MSDGLNPLSPFHSNVAAVATSHIPIRNAKNIAMIF